VFFVFDAYGTLVELDDFYGRLQSGFALRGADLSPEIVTRAAHREMRFYMAHAQSARDENSWRDLRFLCAQVLANAIREQAEFSLSDEQTLEVLSEAIVFRAFPEVREVLDLWRARGATLAVASNWDYQLSQVLQSLDLKDYFSFIFSSAHIGFEKPAPEFFEIVKREVQKVRPDSGVLFYVGDHYEKDVLASRAAGFTPLWLVRETRDVASGETHESDCNVYRLRTLKDI